MSKVQNNNIIDTLTPEEGIAGRFISTKFDKNGRLSDIEFHDDEHFNFGYDVVDALAEKCPDKRGSSDVCERIQ